MPDRLDQPPLEPDDATLAAWIEACARYVRDQIRTLAEQPSWDVEGADRVAASFVDEAPEAGKPLSSILERLGPAGTIAVRA